MDPEKGSMLRLAAEWEVSGWIDFSPGGKEGAAPTGFVTYLNDISFSQYHVFRADAQILP